MTTNNHGVDGATIGEMFRNRAQKTPAAPAYLTKRSGAWQTMTWAQAYAGAGEIAHGLLALGLKLGDRVAILAGTREEWVLCDLGLALAGGVTVPIYPSNTAELCAYILKDSESTIAFVENQKQLHKLSDLRGELAGLRKVVVMDGAGVEESEWVQTLEALRAAGRAHRQANPAALEETGKGLGADSLATIIYTSGTTGNPKGVMQTQAAFVVGTRYVAQVLPMTFADVQVLFLPMAHSFAKTVMVAALRIGFATAFAESIDRLVDNLAEVRPTFMAGVPRIFEKVYGGFLGKAKEGGPLKWKLVNWALGVGVAVSRERQAGREPSGLLALKHKLADKLVFGKLRQRFGGRIRFFISGSAPLSRDLAEFFHAAGLLILEGYGLTETNSLTSVNRMDRYRFGTVGPALAPELEVRIASDGEILTRGVTNLQGYYKLPAETKEAIDEEGWFHTGDIGEIDGAGFIKITDRKKDLIKTSGGKYVAPQMLEGQLKMDPLLSQCVVIGDQRKYVTALIAVNPETAKKLLEEQGLAPPADPAALGQHEAVKKRLQQTIDKMNGRLGSWEQIKYFRVLPRELSEDHGEVTPSLKIKRKVVAERYKDLIDSMYQEKGGGAD